MEDGELMMDEFLKMKDGMIFATPSNEEKKYVFEGREGYDIKVEGGAYGIKITDGTGVSATRIEKPKMAVWSECGEVSMYIENLTAISRKR